MRRAFTPLASLTLPLCLWACGEGGDAVGQRETQSGGASLTVEVDTIAGVPRVHHAGAPAARITELRLELGEVGGSGTPGPQEFGAVNAVTLAPDGRVLVAESQAREIRVFSPAGEHLTTWGREGEGPGEFGALYSLDWLGDTLAVLDPEVGRVGLFGPDGAWLGQFPYPGGVSGPPTLFRLRPTGPHELYVFDLHRAADGIEHRFRRLDASGYGSTLPWLESERASDALLRCPRPDHAMSLFEVPFSAGLEQTPVAGGRLAVTWTGDYRIAFLTATGDTARVVERAVDPVPVTAAAWDSALAEYRTFREEWPGVECSRAMPGRPESRPPIEALWTDRRGRLWVEASSARGTRFDVYDRDGRLLFEVPAPARSERVPPFLSAETVAVVAEGEMGVDRVRVYDLSDASSSMPR